MVPIIFIRNLLKKKEPKLFSGSAFCRTCLRTANLTSIFCDKTNNEARSKELLLVTGLNININDGLPQMICSDCTITLKEAINFRNISRIADKTLLHMGFVRRHAISQGKNDNDLINRFRDEYLNVNDVISENHSGPIKKYDSLEINEESMNGFLTNTHYPEHFSDEYTEECIVRKIKKHKKLKDTSGYKCSICKKNFENFRTLSHHRRCHKGMIKYICEICGKNCITKSSFMQHKRAQHDMERTDKCSFCEYMAINKEQLRIHERVHTGEKPYICDHCDAQFHRRSNMVQHLAVHISIKNFFCDQCPSKFKSIRSLRVHRCKVHKVKRFSYICHLCNNRFTANSSVRLHLWKVHGIPKDKQGVIRKVPLNYTEVRSLFE